MSSRISSAADHSALVHQAARSLRIARAPQMSVPERAADVERLCDASVSLSVVAGRHAGLARSDERATARGGRLGVRRQRTLESRWPSELCPRMYQKSSSAAAARRARCGSVAVAKVERTPEVVQLHVQAIEPLAARAEMRLRLLGEMRGSTPRAAAQLLGLARLLELLGRVLADRLEHPVARLAPSRACAARLLSSSDWSVSGSASATSSAAS